MPARCVDLRDDDYDDHVNVRVDGCGLGRSFRVGDTVHPGNLVREDRVANSVAMGRSPHSCQTTQPSADHLKMIPNWCGCGD